MARTRIRRATSNGKGRLSRASGASVARAGSGGDHGAHEEPLAGGLEARRQVGLPASS